MKKNYSAPSIEIVLSINDEVLVTVSGVTGKLSDGTQIGDGGDDDGSASPSAKERGKHEVFGDLW